MCVSLVELVALLSAANRATKPPMTLAQRALVEALLMAYGAIIIHSPASAASQLAQRASVKKYRIAASTAMTIPNIT
jgi:hypothetical protein